MIRWFGLGLVLLSAGCAQQERWTILCAEIEGPGAYTNARNVAEALKATRGVDPAKVSVHEGENSAAIYYGTYLRDLDPQTGDRSIPSDLRNDLNMIKQLADEERRHYFLGAHMVPAPEADVGTPEWDLRQAGGLYTLQVAVYFNTDVMQDRKLAAVEKTRQLRARGLEAYYYHGPTRSIVTVGAFGEDAVLDETGKVRYVTVGGQHRQVAHHYGPQVVELQQDPDCMYNRTNDDIWYNIDQQTGQRYAVRSMLVPIPEPSSDEEPGTGP